MKKCVFSVLVQLFLIHTAIGQNIVITEIMYNPPESGTDSTEFIEFYNASTEIVDLTGYNSTGGNYAFPAVALKPQEYYVITIDSLAFISVFGFSPNGEFSGGLSNSGESIVLYDKQGVVIDSVRYDDADAWPKGAGAGEPDGGGASIILCDVESDNNLGENWYSSVNKTGVYINALEVLASPGQGNDCSEIVTGLNEESDFKLDIYPNPTSDFIHWGAIMNYQLLDIYGDVVSKGMGEKINIEKESSGVYILILDEKKYTVTKL